jgi:hypothetical protein
MDGTLRVWDLRRLDGPPLTEVVSRRHSMMFGCGWWPGGAEGLRSSGGEGDDDAVLMSWSSDGSLCSLGVSSGGDDDDDDGAMAALPALLPGGACPIFDVAFAVEPPERASRPDGDEGPAGEDKEAARPPACVLMAVASAARSAAAQRGGWRLGGGEELVCPPVEDSYTRMGGIAAHVWRISRCGVGDELLPPPPPPPSHAVVPRGMTTSPRATGADQGSRAFCDQS